MKKSFVVIMLSLLTMSSCGTYTADGAMTGGMFGAMIGSAIGGISGGWRGSHVGEVVGMAGGAVVGAAIGAAEDKKQEEKIQQYRREQAQRRAARQRSYDYGNGGYNATPHSDQGSENYGDSSFDPTNSGDDRIILDLPEKQTVNPVSVKPATLKTKTVTPKKKSKPAKSDEPFDDVYIMQLGVVLKKQFHQCINVYNINGSQAGSAVSNNGSALVSTNLQPGSIAIVKIGEKSVKVVVK